MCPASLQIRPATPTDVSALFALVQGLADYEKLAHEVTGTSDALHQSLFGPQPYAYAVLALVDGAPAGFALYFYNFSTFLM